jgi:hypothetical protein
MATLTTGIFKRFEADDTATRTQVVTSGIWTNDTGSLSTFYTSSTQVLSDASGKYYIDVYDQDPSSTSAEVQFSIAYGDIDGYGAPTLTQTDSSTLPTKAVYTQFRNILNPEDNYFSVYSGSTRDGHDLRNFYVININRARYKERLDPGNISLKLSGSVGTITLIDSSGDAIDTITAAGRVYQMVSGSLNIGTALNATINTYTASNKQGFGLFYPDMGVILLNPAALSASVGGVLQAANSSIAGIYHNNGSDTSGSRALLKSIKGGADFQARRTENVSSQHYFVRANNREFNFSNNPTYVTGSNGEFYQSTFKNNPKSYITSVGLYNDANELLAVAKLSKPVLKSYDAELAVKVRLDF